MANVETASKLARSRNSSSSSTDEELPVTKQSRLTENVESVANSDNSSESIHAEKGVESCQVGEAACEIPSALFDLPDLKTVLSLEVWKTFLTEEERQSLTVFLPALNEETVGKTLEELLAGTNFHFGNPLSDFFEQLKSGFCRPRVARYRDQLKFLQRQKHYHSIKEYHNRMVNVFVEMQKLWEDYPDAEIDERVEIWKSRKSSIIVEPQINQRHIDEIVEDLQRDRWITQSPRKMEIATSKTIQKVPAPSQKRLKTNPGRRVPKGLVKVKVAMDRVMQDAKRTSRPGPKGILKVTDSVSHMSAGHCPKKISVQPEPSLTSSEQAVNPVVGKDLIESDKCSSSKSKEKTMERKLAGSTKFQRSTKQDKHKKEKSNQHKAILQLRETSHQASVIDRKKHAETPEKLEAEPEETLKLSQSHKSEKSSDAKHKNMFTVAELKKGSLKQDKIAVHCPDSLKVEDKRSKQGDDFQVVAGKAEFGTRKRRQKQEKEIVEQLKVDPQKKRPKVEKKAGMTKDLQADEVLGDDLGKVQPKVESLEDQKHDELTNKFLERNKPVEQRLSGEGKQPYHRKSGKDETDGRSFKKNGKKEKIKNTMNGFLERKLGLEDNVLRKPSHTFDVRCERPSKLLKNKQRQKPKKIQNLNSLSLNMEISPPIQCLSEKEGSSLAVKSSRKLVPALAKSLASTLSFSVSYLLSAVRLALMCSFVDRSFDLCQGDQIVSRMDEVKLEKPLMDAKLGIAAINSSPGGNLVSSLKQPKTDLPLHDRGEGVVSVARSCPLHFSEIVKRVQDNPGDSRLLDNRELLQDLVRGALKVFSSRIAPAGAKAWKPLASYDKQTRSWSWIGPPPGISLQDPWEMQILPEAWGVPQKILDKLEETFANWFKHGQETLQQILKFPLPPPPPMPIVLDERERFRELRTQKSLMTIPTSSEDVRAYFQMEELVRYSLPDRAFPYTAADGRKSVVAPLRICGVKLTTKARDHFMLKPDRPPHVTILCLVRDAAARLPQSIGTRADVCALIRDSQFIIEDVSDAQVNQVVSGALDRLHYERDPCVRFDGERKLWMYLHTERHEEDFEDDGTSSTKRWKKPKKEVTDNSGSVQTRCENGFTCVLDEDSSANGINLELNSPDGFDIGEPSAIYSAGSAELVYSKSSSLSSPRVLGNDMNRSLADGEGLPFIELPPLHCGGVDFQNGHTTAWSTSRHGLIWQQGNQFQPNQHFIQDNRMAATAIPNAMLDSIQTE